MSEHWQEERYLAMHLAIHGHLPGEPEPKPARILITGSREFTAVHLVRATLREIRDEHGATAVIAHGNARGADRLAASIAQAWGMPVEAHPAHWDQHGARAGFLRNQAMGDAGADPCLAFLVAGLPCKGTRDCAGRAEKAGIPVRWITQGGAR